MALHPLQTNERLKATSGIIINLGSALVASGAARWFLSGLDPWVAGWIIFGATAMVAGVQLLAFLSPEKAYE
jgi:hypothetical protein